MGDAQSTALRTRKMLLSPGWAPQIRIWPIWLTHPLLGRLSPDVAPHSWDFAASKAMSRKKVYCPELIQHQ